MHVVAVAESSISFADNRLQCVVANDLDDFFAWCLPARNLEPVTFDTPGLGMSHAVKSEHTR